MKKERIYFRGRMGREFVLQEVIQGPAEVLQELSTKKWGFEYTDCYGTAKEVKIEVGYLRAQYIVKELDSRAFTVNADESYRRTEKQNLKGELEKTLKWLEPYYEKYPHVFV